MNDNVPVIPGCTQSILHFCLMEVLLTNHRKNWPTKRLSIKQMTRVRFRCVNWPDIVLFMMLLQTMMWSYALMRPFGCYRKVAFQQLSAFFSISVSPHIWIVINVLLPAVTRLWTTYQTGCCGRRNEISLHFQVTSNKLKKKLFSKSKTYKCTMRAKRPSLKNAGRNCTRVVRTICWSETANE